MYFLFAGEMLYPRGGMDDYVGSFDTLDKAKSAFDDQFYSWAEIAILQDNDLKELCYYRIKPLSSHEVEGWNEIGRE